MATESFFNESTDQSKVKAKIVSEYFLVWASVMLHSLKNDKRIAYLDLFAGPGRYKDGTKSTPLLVLESAIADKLMRDNLVTMFNDSDGDNSSSLQSSIDQLEGIKTLKFKPQVSNEEVGEKIVAFFESKSLIPVFFFVDPWGYKGLSLGLINSVLKNWGCDCVFFFNYNRINMGLNNPIVREHMNVLFGETRADDLRQELEPLGPDERETAIVEALVAALRELGAEYVLPFGFKNENGKRTSHHLVFATKHPRGYQIMKEIMARQSSEVSQGVASFEYSPASAKYPLLFEMSRPLDDLKGLLLDYFAGETRTTLEIFNLHNVGTPYIMRNYKAVLLTMEAEGLISVQPPHDARRKGTFADKVVVTFPAKLAEDK